MTGGTGNDVYNYTANTQGTDIITDFAIGAEDDKVAVTIASIAATKTGTNVANAGDVSAGDTAFQTIAGAGAFNTTANNNVLVFTGAVFNSAAVIEQLPEGGANNSTMTYANANKALKMLAAYDDGTDVYIALVETDAAAQNTSDLAKLDNVSDVSTLVTDNFTFL